MSIITRVEPGSPAEKAGLKPGMNILRVNDREVRDIIDWKHALAFPVMRIAVVNSEGQEEVYRIRHQSGAEIGLGFDSPTLDKLQTCKNNCLFCFVKQMPPGQRETLYIKDDDYRLSLVYGSFVTLTNVSEHDWRRLLEERISPIYVSVHSTNPELRVQLMRNPAAARIMDQIHELISAGITVHAQLVLVPGINDGPELVRSVEDLTGLYPGVESVAVVPVGLTGYRQGLAELAGYDKYGARNVLSTVHTYAAKMRRKHGQSVVYAADEFYILAHSDFPAARQYDGYPQLENGVGVSRILLDEFKSTLAEFRRGSALRTPVLWVTGESSTALMQRLQHEINLKFRVWVDVLTVQNQLFGGRVTVTGLLGGMDICRALEEAEIAHGTRVLIPDITLRDGKFLDNYSVEDLCNRFRHLDVVTCPTNGQDLVRLTLCNKE